MAQAHTFHIPVMGIGFTIDTPLKVSHYGIDSVVSISDDILLEKMRKMYCTKHKIHYEEIDAKTEDYRAKRVTNYLNMLSTLASKKVEELKKTTVEKEAEIIAYFDMLPENMAIKREFKLLMDNVPENGEVIDWIKENLPKGNIDVNIMTKLDRENYTKDEKLPASYNDAHAALRGYANSDLSSSVIFSAGMNPRLFGYMEEFKDFYPDKTGNLKKKITLKVSDYRSALIQGKFLAKKGLWVSEYRIESGLNCGGHAFATEGYLLGPILAEFRDKREELIQSLFDLYVDALSAKNHALPLKPLPLKISAQGGVGTAEEHQFLIEHYEVDSVGWGTPFLLVPEVVNIDSFTLNKLVNAEEEDLYLSNISPLGVPFNNLRGNTKDIEKLSFADRGRPGSSCPKQFLALNKEFTEKGICTASRQYQHLKLQELDSKSLPSEAHQQELDRIVDKSCICVGLGTSALLTNDLETKVEGEGVSVCPGPNLAYFSKTMSLNEITDHIYGRANVITRTDRPNMFIKELDIYIEFLKNKIEETQLLITGKQKKYLTNFVENLVKGANYYHQLFSTIKDNFTTEKNGIITELDACLGTLFALKIQVNNL
jgi:hypothetical protein